LISQAVLGHIGANTSRSALRSIAAID